MSGIYPDVAKNERIRSTFQGAALHNRYAGAVCKRCDCVMTLGTPIVWTPKSGASHWPGDCPPHADREAWQEWASALKAERLTLERTPNPRPLATVFRLEQIEEALAAGWPGPDGEA